MRVLQPVIPSQGARIPDAIADPIATPPRAGHNGAGHLPRTNPMTWKLEAAERAGALRAYRDVLEQKGRAAGITDQWLRERMRTEAESLRAPNSGPATSVAAARSLKLTKDSLRWRALAAYEDADRTDEEVGDIVNHPRIWPRCSELRAMGLIQPTGETRFVPRTGQQAAVCCLTDAGRAAL